ncbi:hypothetical protein F4820DRAFT_454796 [Hypoxylon rubiginosum]|uniref:Uncharacterized protein n=1 Tax=Hypoxylon rubiginosum TaxID=110542 RepID=A0ACB9YGI3_9PEZI|nr:hypothetical protein F4820DRAFT_454796 [Hypoxylon rubiginosum]
MAAPRQSNVERGKWRMKCQERLSQHIEERLGIHILPSDHSVGAYRNLCEGVGVTFKAVRATPESYTGQGAFEGTDVIPISPRLLELSGVGDAKRLQSLGIDVVIDNPNIGENL